MIMKRLGGMFYKFNDLSDEAQLNFMDAWNANDEYWELLENEVDNYLKSKFQGIEFEWWFDGDDLYITNEIYDN